MKKQNENYFSLEAEQAVLGGLLLESENFGDVKEILKITDFHSDKNKFMYQQMCDLKLAQKPIDRLTLIDNIKTKNISEEKKKKIELYVYELVNNTPSTVNILAYAKIIKEKSEKRSIILWTEEVKKEMSSEKTEDIILKAEKGLNEIKKTAFNDSNFIVLGDELDITIDNIITSKNEGCKMLGLSTGFNDLDEIIQGLKSGEMIIVAARPSMGKTSFCTNIAEHICLEGGIIAFFSMEMTASSLSYRVLSSQTKINHSFIKSGKISEDQMAKLKECKTRIAKLPFIIDEQGALTPDELRLKSLNLNKNYPLSCIIVDYIQLMHSPNYHNNRVQEIADISTHIKALAKELKIPVIAISQLNRGLEHRNDKKPMMSDLRDSGSLEQDADVIIFIYRDAIYNKKPASTEESTSTEANIIISKNRNGAIGEIVLDFIPQFVKFENKKLFSGYKWNNPVDDEDVML